MLRKEVLTFDEAMDVIQRLWDQHYKLVSDLIPLLIDDSIPQYVRDKIDQCITATDASDLLLEDLRAIGVAEKPEDPPAYFCEGNEEVQ